MNQRIHWLWFVLSQIGFGMVAGLVVARQRKNSYPPAMPLAVRMGIEAPGLMGEQTSGDRGHEIQRTELRRSTGDHVL